MGSWVICARLWMGFPVGYGSDLVIVCHWGGVPFPADFPSDLGMADAEGLSVLPIMSDHACPVASLAQLENEIGQVGIFPPEDGCASKPIGEL